MYRDEDIGLGSDDLARQNLTGVNEDSPIANTPVRVLTVTSIMEDNVKNYDEKNVGKIQNIMVDLKSGCIEYVVLEFGGFLGIGEKLFAIPFKSLTLEPNKQTFYLDVNKELLKNAPGFDTEHWPQTNSNHWGDVDTYWSKYKGRYDR